MENFGGVYFIASANSGEAVATQAMTAGAGVVHGGSLEKSNADVATEFVNMIQAQNGFHANTRTIGVANETLREPTSLARQDFPEQWEDLSICAVLITPN